MKLELKHLAAYLPYGLKGLEYIGAELHELTMVQTNAKATFIWNRCSNSLHPSRIDCKPILKPLSDVRNAIEEIYNESWMAGGYIIEEDENGINILSNEDDSTLCISIEKPWVNMQWINDILYRLHFDLHGLIDEGLAFDINTISAKAKHSPV